MMIRQSSEGTPQIVKHFDYATIATGFDVDYNLNNARDESLKFELSNAGIDVTLTPGQSNFENVSLVNASMPFGTSATIRFFDGTDWRLFYSTYWPVTNVINANDRILRSRTARITNAGQSHVHSVVNTMSRNVKIPPHAPGTLEYPGLPLASVTTHNQKKYMLLQPEEWRKITIQVFPAHQHFTYSNGFRLNFGTGLTGAEPPQEGWEVFTESSGHLSSLTIPPDGKIVITDPESELYSQLNSPAGIVIHLKRDMAVNQSHVLSIDVLPKVTANEPVRLGSLNVVPAAILPDYNRDGQINAEDAGKITADNPWRFWINDDDDSGDTGGSDIPLGENAPDTNSQNNKVDGLKDLVDFFPLHLDIKALLELHPPEQYNYRLTHPHPSNDPALRVVIAPQLSPEKSDDYLKDLDTAKFYQGAETRAIHATGPLLESGQGQPGMLDALAEGEGLLLIEGVKHTTDPIVLKIEKKIDNQLITELHFHIDIQGVENMFRFKNLRPDASSYNPPYPPAIDRVGEPPNMPDALCNDDWFIFLHGYNVNEYQAWGWHAEAFKRLFWSGNKAKFVGVSWHGDETQNVIGVTPKYHKNVVNALETAGHLSTFANELEGGGKYFGAHSLGSLVTAYAIAHEGMDAEKAFFFNPAIPTEALLPRTAIMNDSHIEPASWRGYPEVIKASDWYDLFPGTDARSSLTWRGLLHAAAPKLKIFFSEGEEVLAALPLQVPADPGLAANAPTGQYAFCIQAMLKGEAGNEPYASQESFNGTLASLITKAFDSLSPATTHGGWRWTTGEVHPFYGIPNSDGSMTRTFPFHILDAPDDMERLKTDPVFGISIPAGCQGLFHETDGHAVADDPEKFRRILADMIPERTLSAGGAGGSGVAGEPDENNNPTVDVISLEDKAMLAGTEIQVFDMQDKRNGWPQSRPPIQAGNGWRHGDIRAVAYVYVWEAWQEIVNDGELNLEP